MSTSEEIQKAIDGLATLSYISPQWWNVAEKAINVIRGLTALTAQPCDMCESWQSWLSKNCPTTMGEPWPFSHCPACGRKIEGVPT